MYNYSQKTFLKNKAISKKNLYAQRKKLQRCEEAGMQQQFWY